MSCKKQAWRENIKVSSVLNTVFCQATLERCFRTVLLINVTPFYIPNCHLFLFADDRTMFESFRKTISDFILIQNDLNSISDICKKMQMQISISKCQVLTLNEDLKEDHFLFTC